MAMSQRPNEPLIAILGTTGTGKSDLAVDLAVRFNGEIINADAMQMYRGLPVITNQITAEEQRGIPHHLLATIELDQPTWTIGIFAREATKLIREIRSRGKLPIVVGGTHYYISSLLFENSLVNSEDLEQDESNEAISMNVEEQHPILAGPTELMMRKLQEVDPVMAARWHPDDRRKIRRSLEIFLATGKRASDIYAGQRRMKPESVASDITWQALMFWVYSKPDILTDRLDRRVGKMENRGLMEEVRDLHEHLRRRTASGEDVDRTRGIWQSIGFKQFEAFLDAEKAGQSSKSLAKLKATSVEDMKTATRQYARQQLRWIRGKTIPSLEEKAVMNYLYILDSSEAPNFAGDVLSPAADITQRFLSGSGMPKPSEISETAVDVLSSLTGSNKPPKQVLRTRKCEICNTTLATDDQWKKHIGSKRHHRVIKHKNRTALVPIENAETRSDRDEPPEVDLTGFP